MDNLYFAGLALKCEAMCLTHTWIVSYYSPPDMEHFKVVWLSRQWIAMDNTAAARTPKVRQFCPLGTLSYCDAHVSLLWSDVAPA